MSLSDQPLLRRRRLVVLFALALLVAWGIGCGRLGGYEANKGLAAEGGLSGAADPLYPANPLPTPSASISPPATPTAVPTSSPAPFSPTPTAELPTFTNPRDDVLAQAAADAGAEFVWLNEANTGVWQYAPGSFLHPIALDVWHDAAFLLDGGRVLAIDLVEPSPPRLLLSPGEAIAGARVIEPLDLAVAGDVLLVLDRAGDVYNYDLITGAWGIDRYDRPVRDTSSHYFVAVTGEGDGRTLLETNYKYAMRYTAGQQVALWSLPEARMVDVSGRGDAVYVLMREMDEDVGSLALYRETSQVRQFRPNVTMERPRQVAATETAVFVLDGAGQRLLAFALDSGVLLRLYQLPRPDAASAFWVDSFGERLIVAGRERLYFYNQPERLAAIAGGPTLTGRQPHDPTVLEDVTGFIVPVGSQITRRDLQMPGAPRHYRLGVHEGVDLYWQPGTLVYAAADGVVIRATHDYVLPSAVQFSAWWSQTHQLGYTSAEGLDFYRGIQVWIQHDNGLISRYAHLGGIDYTIVEDTRVTQGQIIGWVGNSGSPASLESESADAHLHFELWLGDHYLGQYLRPIETREWLERILQ